MIGADEILTALGKHLTGMAQCPSVVWPNQTSAPAKPYLVVQIAGKTTTKPALSKGAAGTRGQMIVTVVADLNAFSTAADKLAQRVADHFDRDTTALTGSGGTVQIADVPTVLAGYPDEASWRVPVRIPFVAQ